jgi:outer membrane lipoprotein
MSLTPQRQTRARQSPSDPLDEPDGATLTAWRGHATKTLCQMSLLAAIALSGCASTHGTFGEAQVSEQAPTVQAVRDSPQSFRGQQVRWGGTIAAVHNNAKGTCLEVVSTALEGGGRPKNVDRSGGRFIGCIDQFLDPAIYTEGREVTVIGTVSGTQTGTIGDLRYQYPVVTIERARLWEEELAWGYYDYPWSPYGYYWW